MVEVSDVSDTAAQQYAPPHCYRHPGRAAGAVCRRCDRPICPECMREAPVGWQCSDCLHRGHRRAPVQRWRPRGPATLGSTRITPVVTGLIVLNVVIFLVTAHNQTSIDARFGMWPFEVSHGQWYRLITAAFLHLNISHIFFNMVTLAIIGSPVEANLGKVRFLALYLLSAAGGSVSSYLLSPYNSLGVGASGAIFGLMGAYFVLARRNRSETTTVLALIGVNLVIDFLQPGIDWRAHLGGLAIGASVAFGLGSGGDLRRGMHAIGRRAGEVATVAVAAAVIAALAQLPPGHVNL
jgi:membrane associated rhomboid family serine protease